MEKRKIIYGNIRHQAIDIYLDKCRELDEEYFLDRINKINDYYLEKK